MPLALPPVRVAKPEDEDALCEMCARLHEENGLFRLNPEKVRKLIQTATRPSFKKDAVKAIIGVIGDVGHLEASTCLVISDYYYTDEWHLGEMWNFVDKQYRRSRNAEAIIEFGKATALKLGMPLLTGIITNKQMAGKVRLYQRLLGYPTGAFFIFNAPWKSEPMAKDYSDLRRRLRQTAEMCNNEAFERIAGVFKLSPDQVRKKLKEMPSLLKEAAEAVAKAEDLWDASKGE